MEQLEQTLTSLEVAEMVEKTHANLLRDVKRYCKQIDQINIDLVDDNKIVAADFFKNSTYTDGKGEERFCYNITKKGCEFIAHKMTGTKGTAFTARYINKFHTMEQALHQPQLPHDEETEQIFASWSSPTLLPPPPKETWYERNKDNIRIICKINNWERKFLYHKILTELGTLYDLNRAKSVYQKKNGFLPYYATDIIEYFPQLQEQADKYIKYLLGD